MQVLDPKVDLDKFFHQIRDAPQRALLLDYDGTLAPFRVNHAEAIPYPGVADILNAIAQHTRLVIVSGRPIQELRQLVRLHVLPELWGSHGWERLTADGRYALGPIDPSHIRGLVAARAVLERHGLDSLCETKPAGLALHWRHIAPYRQQQLRALLDVLLPSIATYLKLDLLPFDGGMELRVPGRSKGFAVRSVLYELDSTAASAYLGDDLTDEDAFAALRGRGLGVLVRPQLRPTGAQLWLTSPNELFAFLDRWHSVLLTREAVAET